MTPSPSPGTEARPPLSLEDFEELARKAPETVTLEFINAKLEVKPVPDQLHRAMVMWLLTECMRQRPELLLYPEQDLKVEAYRTGRAIADGALALVDHFVKHDGEWADPDGVLITVDVTSWDRDTSLRDRVQKRDGYAAAGIPVYLLVDRDAEELVVYSEPRKGAYKACTAHPYGDTVKLPEPVSITLETEKLKDYTR